MCTSSHMWVCVCIAYHYFSLGFSLFERLDPISTALWRALVLTHPLLYVDALQTFTCQKQQGRAGGSPKCCSGGERCVYVCDYRFDLSPHAGPFAMQTKGDTLQIAWRFTTHLLWAKRVALRAPCHFGGHMFPIENSLLPSRHISVSLWFKPETKEGLSLSLSYVPCSKSSILKWSPPAGISTLSFFSSSLEPP